MKYLLFIVVLLLIFCSSCISTGEGGDGTQTTLYNYSGLDVEFQLFRKGKYISSSFIKNGEGKEYTLNAEEGGPLGPTLPPFETVTDSVQVIYGELASIWHTKAANQIVSKSLLLASSYKGGKVKDGLYEFTYTFTEDDFQEAVDFGD